MTYKETSGDDAYKIPRFDWITIIDEDTPQKSKVVQLQALIRLSYPSGQTQKSIFFYLAADTDQIKKTPPKVSVKE